MSSRAIPSTAVVLLISLLYALLATPGRAGPHKEALDGIAKIPDVGCQESNGKVARVIGIGPKVTDKTVTEVMKYRTGLEHLEFLHIQGSKLTSEGMKEIYGLPSLTHLWLMGNGDVTDAGISALKELPKLRDLQLLSTRVTGTGLKPDGTPNLENLDLRQCPVTTDGLKAVAGYKKLRTLHLAWTRVEDVSPLKQLTTLKELSLSGTLVTDENLATLDNAALETLWVNRTKVTGAGLKGLKSLRAVYLTDTPTNDEGLKGLAGAAALKTLGLMNTEVTDAGLKQLAGLDKLERLDLKKTKVKGSGIKDLAGCKSLNMLELDPKQITDESLKALVEIKLLHAYAGSVTSGKREQSTDDDIHDLSLNDSQVTDEGLKVLHGLKALRFLGLSRTKITDEGVAELKKALPDVKVFR
jgi:internalin A